MRWKQKNGMKEKKKRKRERMRKRSRNKVEEEGGRRKSVAQRHQIVNDSLALLYAFRNSSQKVI